ncbi:MAG: glutamyl-tRNA reductase [Lachnospiraceae bacterium]|nr:glutamyl-tRNA reductase [Lachnospiraceae bacterium]
MFCISASYKKTPLEARQGFAFSQEEQYIFTEKLIQDNIIKGGVILSTCNRSEIYFTGSSHSVEEVARNLALFKNTSDGNIKKYCLFYGGSRAASHLFNVTCGLDSMVLGEDEILRQVKEAYLAAFKAHHTDSELNIIFQDALNCAKSGKSKTRLSTTPVSIGTITANTIEKYIEENINKDNFPGKRVLVIGITGKTGGIVAKDLASKGIQVTGTTRKRGLSAGTWWQGSRLVEVISFEERYKYINQVCAIASATTSPHYTLTYNEYLKYAADNQKRLLIDLAVPYDIDRKLAGLQNIKLLDIDYFNTLSKENTNIKLGELGKAEETVKECVEDTMKKIYIRGFLASIKENTVLADKFNKEKWFSHMVYYLKDVLGSDGFKDVLERIYNKETNGGE